MYLKALAGKSPRLSAIHVENNPVAHKTIHAIYGLEKSWQLSAICLPYLFFFVINSYFKLLFFEIYKITSRYN